MAESVTKEEEKPVVQAQTPARRPHRPNPAAARPAPRAAAAQSSLAPKKGMIRLLCVQSYMHGHRLQVPPRLIKELEGYADLDPKDIRAAQTQYEAGKEYYLPASQAARLLRDKGPARFRNPLTEKIERRKEADIYFRATDRDELERYLDNELDKIEDRREAVVETDVNDQNLPEDDDEDE